MPHIRKAEEKDTERIEYICRMTAGPESREDEQTGKKIALTYATYYARAERETSFVLDDSGETVGYVICAPDFKRFFTDFRKNEVKELLQLDKAFGLFAYVLPLSYLPFYKKYPAHLHINLLDDYQSKGYGAEMINTLILKLREMHVPGVMLIVDSKNHGAQRFYKRMGFREKISLFGGVVMVKEL